jgi:Protein of unknown function (DUF4230)
MRHQTSPKLGHSFLHLLRSLGLIVTGGSIMVGALLLLGMWQSGDRFLAKLAGFLTPPKAEPQADVRSVVVKQVQDASELTTAIFTMEAVVPTQQDNSLGGLVIGSTKLLYIAYGQVRAGVDLSQLKPSDVMMTEAGLLIRLPAPRLLDSKIDVSRSNVYDYNRGFLGLGPDTAPALQTLAQQKALDKIVEAACREGILQKANDRARLVVSQLVNLPGYKNVTVDAQAPGECKVTGNNAAVVPGVTPSVAPGVTPSVAPSLPASQPIGQPTPPPVNPSALPNNLPAGTDPTTPTMPMSPLVPGGSGGPVPSSLSPLPTVPIR